MTDANRSRRLCIVSPKMPLRASRCPSMPARKWGRRWAS